MKKYTLLFIVLLILSSNFSFGQDNIADTTLANSYFEKANLLMNNEQYDSAKVFFKMASKTYIVGGYWVEYLKSENNLGLCFQNQEELDKSINVIKSALSVVLEQIDENNSFVALAYFNLGFPYYYKMNYDSVLICWKKALEIRKNIYGEKHIEVAMCYNNIGAVYINTFKFNLALQNHLNALKIREEILGKNSNVVALSYNNIGDVYYEMNDFDIAIESYLKGLQISIELHGEINNNVAKSYNNIGNIYWNKKEYNLALEYHFKSLKIRRELFGEKSSDVSASYNNIGVIYYDKGEYDLAIHYLGLDIELLSESYGEKHKYIASNYNNIGNVYLDKQELSKALEYYNKSLEIRKELFGERHTLVAQCYNNIGLVYFEKNDNKLALEYFFKSIEIERDLIGEKHTSIALTYNNIGDVYEKIGNKDLALKYYQKILVACLISFNDSIEYYTVPVIKDYLNWEYLLEALKEKARVFAKSNNTSDLVLAIRHYQACDTLINAVRKEINTRSDKLTLGEFASKVYGDAITVCQKLIDISEKDRISYYKELAFYFSEKNKSSVLIEALAGAQAQEFAGIPDTLLSKEYKLRIDIALYNKLLAEQPDSTQEILFRDKLFTASREYDALIKTFEGDYPDYFELKYNRKPASVEDIQKILDDKTAMVSYFLSDTTTSIFIITKNNIEIKTVSTIENLVDAINYYRNGLIYTSSTRFSEMYKEYAYDFYKQLIPNIDEDEIENLIIIPDAELSMIPFETLLTEEYFDKRWNELPYLIKKYNISYSYSANLFYKTFPKEPATEIESLDLNDWLAFAPVFDDSKTAGVTMRTRELLRQFDSNADDSIGTRGKLIDGGYISPLPGTETEVQSIFKSFDEKGKKALVQIKKNANEEYIKSGGLKDYKFLHFATHGFVNTEKPELSGIFLAQDSTLSEDGILYQGEIYNLNLNADLTVLSACETGLGQIKKGEGLIGLTRALLYAGSKNIIVSLWKVADDSTSDLMIDFYKNLLEKDQENKEFSEALRKAKLKMIEEGKYAHPFYWSPFILIGK